MFSRKVTSVLTMTAVSSVAALALTVPAAQAAPAHEALNFYNCAIGVSEPTVHDGVLSGFASSACVGNGWQDQQLVVNVEEYLFPTLIVVRARATTGYSSSSRLFERVSFKCTGTSEHYYTIEASWYGAGGNAYAYRYPPIKRKLAC